MAAPPVDAAATPDVISRFSGWVGEWRVEVLDASLPAWVNTMVEKRFVPVQSLEEAGESVVLAHVANAIAVGDVFGSAAEKSGRKGIVYPVRSADDAVHNVRRCMAVLNGEGARISVKASEVAASPPDPTKILRLLVEMYEFHYGRRLGFGPAANFTKALLRKVKELLRALDVAPTVRRALDDALDRLVNFTTSWQSGLLFACLAAAVCPAALAPAAISTARPAKDALRTAFGVLADELGIPSLVDPAQLLAQPEEITTALYVAMVLDAHEHGAERELRNRVAQLERELEATTALAVKVGPLEAALAHAEAEAAAATAVNAANEGLNLELYDKSDQVSELQTAIRKLTANNTALKRSLAQAKDALAATSRDSSDPSLVPVVRRMESDVQALLSKDVSSRMLALQAQLKKMTERLGRLELQHRMHEKGVTISRASEDNVPAPQGNVILLATRVQGANRLWIKHPSVMARALNIHHAFLRTVLPTYGGYEVRVDGDSFLVAFASPIQALRCVLFLQSELMKREWPREIIESEDDDLRVVFAPSGSTLFRGLRVSMALHLGRAQTLDDPVSGRVDYQGDAVELAQALVLYALGGQILVSEPLLAAVEDSLHALSLGTDPPVVTALEPVVTPGSTSVTTPIQISSAELASRSFAAAKRTVAEDVIELYKTRNLDAIQAALTDLGASAATLHAEVDELAADFADRIQSCVSLQHRMKELSHSVADPVEVRLALDKSIQVLHAVPSALNPEVSALAQAKRRLDAHSEKVTILEEVVTSLVEGQRNRWKGTPHARFASSFLDSKRESLAFAEEKKELVRTIDHLKTKLDKAQRAVRLAKRASISGPSGRPPPPTASASRLHAGASIDILDTQSPPHPQVPHRDRPRDRDRDPALPLLAQPGTRSDLSPRQPRTGLRRTAYPAQLAGRSKDQDKDKSKSKSKSKAKHKDKDKDKAKAKDKDKRRAKGKDRGADRDRLRRESSGDHAWPRPRGDRSGLDRAVPWTPAERSRSRSRSRSHDKQHDPRALSPSATRRRPDGRSTHAVPSRPRHDAARLSPTPAGDLPALSANSGASGTSGGGSGTNDDELIVEEIFELDVASSAGAPAPAPTSSRSRSRSPLSPTSPLAPALPPVDSGSLPSLNASDQSSQSLRPASPASPPPPTPPARVIPSVPSILLVEPNQVSQIMGKVVLEQHGYECFATADGDVALGEFESRMAAGTPFMLVLTVVDLTADSGFDLCARIRARERDAVWFRTPVVVMTNDAASHIGACIASGVDGIFPAPISMSTTFVSTIFRHLADGDAEKETLAAPGSVAIAHMIRRDCEV